MSELRVEVRAAIRQALEAVPAPLRTDPDAYIEDVTTAALNAVQGSLLADLGSASAAITAAEFKVMDDCRPPDIGVPAVVS
jgi:hypothetical protein